MLLKLFSKFFKIGLFTFGGGYAMISLVKDEFVFSANENEFYSNEKDSEKTAKKADIKVNKKNNEKISEEEFMRLIAVAEATPGPIAINMATYIGYRIKGLVGAIVATVGVVLPSLIIIYIISLFLTEVLKIKIVADIFIGISLVVAYIIIRTGLSLIRSEMRISDNKIISGIVFIAILFIILLTDFLNININVVFLILASIFLGAIIYFVNKHIFKSINGNAKEPLNHDGGKEVSK